MLSKNEHPVRHMVGHALYCIRLGHTRYKTFRAHITYITYQENSLQLSPVFLFSPIASILMVFPRSMLLHRKTDAFCMCFYRQISYDKPSNALFSLKEFFATGFYISFFASSVVYRRTRHLKHCLLHKRSTNRKCADFSCKLFSQKCIAFPSKFFLRKINALLGKMASYYFTHSKQFVDGVLTS